MSNYKSLNDLLLSAIKQELQDLQQAIYVPDKHQKRLQELVDMIEQQPETTDKAKI